MPLFEYKAKKGPREIVEGKIEAENKDAVIARLLELGFAPLKIELSGGVSSAAQKPAFFRMSFGKVRRYDIDIFTRQLASLIKSGITLLRSLTIIKEQTENLYFKWVISNIETEVEKGEVFSGALLKYPKIFPSLYVNIIKSGETSGALDEALNRLVEFREKEEEMRSLVKSALTYPVFLMIAGALTVFFMLTFFMPRLLELFKQLGQVLPLPTRILIAVSNFAKTNWVWIIIAFSILFLVIKRKNTTKNERLVMDWIKLKVPVLGCLIRKSEISKFSRALAVLLKSGISVVESVGVSIPLVAIEKFRDELTAMNKEIISGSSFSEAMKKVSHFSPMVINVISIGEEGGRLEEALLEISDFYEKEVDRALKMITSLMEPAIIIVIGAVVGFIVFAMLLPIFNIDMIAR